ncbi:hypothetical protein [Bacteroides reticulotermitis]|uniref:hypothetical protein n=1 Tax=Bacteroides reticulotermitis TaxID=1133319 RepID=UPI003A8ADD21
MVGLNIDFDFTDLEDGMDDFLTGIISRLVEAGEAGYNKAVSSGLYQNITGNLRSSIGYVVAVDGAIIKEGGFVKIKGGGPVGRLVGFSTKQGDIVSFWAKGRSGDGSLGSKQGLEYARSLAKSTSGYTLIVVAGMDYASYVNSKGYDVFDSAEIDVRILLGKE